MKKTKNIIYVVLAFIVVSIFSQIGKDLGKSVTKKADKIEENKPWFRNSYFGISIETPYKLEPQDAKPPEGYEEYISTIKFYSSHKEGIGILMMYMDTKFETYDTKIGLEGAINNVIHTLGGSDVNYTFNQKSDNELEDIFCSGTFTLKNEPGILKGYCYWNKKGKIAIIWGLGSDSDKTNNILTRAIKSIRIVF